MSEFTAGGKGNKVTKFSTWNESDKLRKDGKNAFKVFRKLKKQLKAEAFSGKANCLDQYPAIPYRVKYPTESSWLLVDPDNNSPVTISPELQEKLKTEVFKSYLEEVRDYARQDEKIYELLVQQVCSQDSLDVIKAEPEWKKIDGREVQNDWISLYNLMVKTHVIQIGGKTSEAKLVAASDTRYELYHFKQSAVTPTGQHFEDHEDLVTKCNMLGMIINEQELSFLLINSMYHRASREKREFDLKMGTPLPNLLSTTYTYIRHAENLHRSIQTLNSVKSGRDAELNRALATEVLDYRSNGSSGTGRLSRIAVKKMRRINRNKYTPEEKKAFNALPESERAAIRAEKASQAKPDGRKAAQGGSANAVDKRVCYKCNKPGHIARDCRSKVDQNDHKLSMLVAESGYEDYDRYEECLEDKHEIFVTKKVQWLEDDTEDLSSLDSDNLYFKCPDNKRHERENEGESVIRQACLVVNDEEESILSEGEKSRDSKEIMQLLTESGSGHMLRRAAWLPNLQEVKLQLDLINQEKLFEAMGGGYNLVRCDGVLVEENGVYDTRNIPEGRVIDNWQDYYLKPRCMTDNYQHYTNNILNFQGSPEDTEVEKAKGPYTEKRLVQHNTKANIDPTEATKIEVKVGPSIKKNNATGPGPKMATTVRIPFHQITYPKEYNEEDYRRGQRWILSDGTESDFMHRVGEMIEIGPDGRDVKPDHPCGEDRSGVSQSTDDDQGDGTIPDGLQDGDTTASGSLYCETLPEGFEAGSRRSPRLHPEPDLNDLSHTHSHNVSLSTGLCEWDREQRALRDQVRKEACREMEAVSDAKSPVKRTRKKNEKSPEKPMMSPAREEIWKIMKNVRINDENLATKDNAMASLQRKVLRHRERLVEKGVKYYVNELMMKRIELMDPVARESMKELVSDSFYIVEGENGAWRVAEDRMKSQEEDNSESRLFSTDELEEEFGNTNLMTTKLRDRRYHSDSSSPHSYPGLTAEQEYPWMSRDRARVEELRSAVEISNSAGHAARVAIRTYGRERTDFQVDLTTAKIELVRRLRANPNVMHIKEVGAFRRFSDPLAKILYDIIRTMEEWEELPDYSCMVVVAALEYDEFDCRRTNDDYLRSKIRRWYINNDIIGVVKNYKVDLGSVVKQSDDNIRTPRSVSRHNVRSDLFSPIAAQEVINLCDTSQDSSDGSGQTSAKDSTAQGDGEETPSKKVKVEGTDEQNLIMSHNIKRRGIAEISEDIFDYQRLVVPESPETKVVGQIDIRVLEGLRNSVAQSVGQDDYLLLDEDLISLGSWASGLTFFVNEFSVDNRVMMAEDRHEDGHGPNDADSETDSQHKRRRTNLDWALEDIDLADTSSEENSKASDFQVSIYSRELNVHRCLVTSASMHLGQDDGNRDDTESDSSEVSEDSDPDAQLNALTIPPEYIELTRRATNLYQISLRNEEFRRFRTVVVEEAQRTGAIIRARAMANIPGETEESIREYMKDFSTEAFERRRERMATASVLPDTTFWGLKREHLFYVIEDGLGDYSYSVRSFETEEDRTVYLSNVHRRNASAFPVSNEQGVESKVKNINNSVVIVSPEEFSVIMKECYMMSDHTSNDTPSQNKDSDKWWSGETTRGTRYWSVSDWMSVCSGLAHILPIMAMAYLSKKSEERSKDSSKNIVYRKCIQFMIWCYNLGNNINNSEREIDEKILMTLDTHMYVILDSGSTAHMVRDAGLLTNIRKMPKPAFIGGVENGGEGIVCRHWGDMMGLKRVMYSERSSANILSLSALKDKGHMVRFDDKSDRFIVKFLDNSKEYEFTRDKTQGAKSRHYGCNMNRAETESMCVRTVKDNLRQYTVAEVEKARAAREQANMLGFVTTDAHCNMIKSGDIQNNNVTVADVYRALKIWGPSIPSVMGKTKQTAPPKAIMETLPPAQHETQVLEIDVFFVQEIPFLIGVLNPMCYCMSAELKSRNETQIRGVLMSMISACRANNIDIVTVRSDNEKGLIALKNDIQIAGIKLELAPPGGHVPLPERKICQLKSIVRATKASVPWEMPKVVVVFCVLFATGCINYQRIMAKPYVMSPYQQFTGGVIDSALHLKAPFGAYAQATVATTDNSMNPRTHSAIVLGPTLNKTGSYKVLELGTWNVVTRHKIRVLPTPVIVTDFMTKRATEDFSKNRMKKDPIGGDIDVKVDDETDTQKVHKVGGKPFDGREWYDTHLEHRSELPMNVDRKSEEADSESRGDVREQESDEHRQEEYDNYWTEEMLHPDHEIHKKVKHGYGLRSGVKHHTLVMSVKSAIKEHGMAAEESVKKELQQMIDKKVWHPVKKSELKNDQIKGIIRSSMFLKEKFDSTGKFEKLKARLVANGNMQDKTIYGDNMSSPTSALSSVFTIAAIAAHEGRKIKTLDIGGAYLNADMHKTGIDVFMRLDGKIVDLLCDMNQTYKDYRVTSEKGDYIIVNLDRALYGCVESAKLWYDDLKDTLSKAGYTVNALDECVFNKGMGEEQCTIALHVDDMIITSKKEQIIDELIHKLRERYTEGITVHEGPVVSYLGMTFDWNVPGSVKITQEGYIAELLNGSGVDGMAKTPAAENLYEVREETPLATTETSEWFHSQVAKLLYLAKRTKPECLTAVAYLSTRVTKCNLDDVVKLIRLIKYVRRTKNTGIVLRPGKSGITVRGYIDAAYGVHDDGKSVTGCVISIGDAGPIHAKSTKQKIVTKSSTEAELVATSDSANQTLHMRQFLNEQGYVQSSAEIFQDNISCMNLLNKGKSCSERTRHMSIRYFWLTEKIRKNEIKLTHIRTEDMSANILTKPLQGAQFDRERRLLTNWEQ